MKALSVQQPWAWLIVNGYKDIENRGWHTPVRGTVYIHTGLKFDQEGYEWVRRNFPGIRMPFPAEFPRGGIVGKVRIVDCVTRSESRWFFGRYGFVLTDQAQLAFTRVRGELKFFDVNPLMLNAA